MPGGRPTTPTEVKRRRGTLRKDRTPAPLTVLAPLADEAIGTDELAEGLRQAGAPAWLGQTDKAVLALAHRLAADADRLRAALDDEFNKDVHAAYIATIKEYRGCLSALGLTPSDRSRLGVAEVKARSKLEELMDRRAGRRAS